MVNNRLCLAGVAVVTGSRDSHADGLKALCAVAADVHAGGWLVSVGGLFAPNTEAKRLVHGDCLCICYTISKFCSTRLHKRYAEMHGL